MSLTMEDHPTPAITTAAAPFDKCTDLILRSSDMVEFHVWSIILREASPMFDAMLSLPQPAADPNHDVPVIPVTEDGMTLRGVLELCYPMAPSIVREKNLDKVLHIIEAALKYNMEWPVALVAQSLKELADGQPLRVYAIAQRHGMEELAQYAAKVTLKNPFPGEYCSELEDITGGAYYRLVKYRENCSKALGTLTQNLNWMGRRAQYVWFNCLNPKCVPAAERYIFEGTIPKQWWVTWMDSAVGELRKKPCRETALMLNTETVSVNLPCSSCKARAHIDLCKLRRLMADEVKTKLEVVSH